MRPAIAFVLFTLLGCRGGTPDVITQPQIIAGTYALATIGAARLPADYPPGLSITSSRLVALAAGTWTEARSSIAAGQVNNVTYFGTWTQSGNDVEFRSGPTTIYTGVATSSGLRLTSGGAMFTYSRE